RARPGANRPVGGAFDHDALRAVDLEATLGIYGFEPGPPHEVADGCRAMTAEITFRQRGERFVASERGGVGRTSGELRVGELLAAARAAADHAFELRVNCQHGERHALGGDAAALEMRTQLGSRERLFFKCTLEDGGGTRAKGRIESKLAAVVRDDAMNLWLRQFQHPTDVGGGDEVPGRPHDVRAQDSTRVERAI